MRFVCKDELFWYWTWSILELYTYVLIWVDIRSHFDQNIACTVMLNLFLFFILLVIPHTKIISEVILPNFVDIFYIVKFVLFLSCKLCRTFTLKKTRY